MMTWAYMFESRISRYQHLQGTICLLIIRTELTGKRIVELWYMYVRPGGSFD